MSAVDHHLGGRGRVGRSCLSRGLHSTSDFPVVNVKALLKKAKVEILKRLFDFFIFPQEPLKFELDTNWPDSDG